MNSHAPAPRWGECACCLMVRPDVHPLGELGAWCDTCACENGGCLHAAMDEMLDREMTRAAGRTASVVTWEQSDYLHRQLGSTVRNHDRAWTQKPCVVVDAPPSNPAPPNAIIGWWNELVGLAS